MRIIHHNYCQCGVHSTICKRQAVSTFVCLTTDAASSDVIPLQMTYLRAVIFCHLALEVTSRSLSYMRLRVTAACQRSDSETQSLRDLNCGWCHARDSTYLGPFFGQARGLACKRRSGFLLPLHGLPRPAVIASAIHLRHSSWTNFLTSF